MKKILLYIIIQIFINQISFSQNWQWAKQIGGQGKDIGGIMLDTFNNVYCIGYFESTLFFTIDTLYSNGINDVFIAKYDQIGGEVWQKSFGGSNLLNMNIIERPTGFAIDNKNNCFYISGRFYGSLNIDSFFVNTAGGTDLFIAKFDFSGTCQWIKRAGGSQDEYVSTTCILTGGSVLWSTELVIPGNIDTITVDAGTYLTKINANGTIDWVQQQFKGGYCTNNLVIENEIISSGITNNDTLIISTDTLFSPNFADGFIIKYDTNGTLIWAKIFTESSSSGYASNFSIDNNKNIYVIGSFTNSLTIDTITIMNNNKSDMYFAKLSPAGNVIWVKQIHATGLGHNTAFGIDKEDDDTFYITGYFGGSAIFGNFPVTASTNQDMFLARYDTNGDCIGVKNFGEATGNGVKCNHFGNSVYVSGIFKNTVTIGSTSLTSNGDYDMFFAKSDAILGISEGQRPVNDLIIYANPTTGKCNVTIPAEFINEKNLTLQLFDNNGKLLQQTKVEMNENKIILNLEQQAKGIYQVTLSNGKKQYGGKIVFE